ncbi:fatty acyl-AMP ligase [Nocardiopsis rhodophaea]|uniref:fatty acyl-AMP ligase n=1 Tax=Nocardiopsis rhodophaea TaxID=280238 RepID=UPI0031D3052A
MTAFRTRFPSILHALLEHAEHGTDGPKVTLVPEPGREETLHYDALVESAARCAAALAEYGVGHGDRVVLCLPTGPQFVTAFFGTQLLGAMPTAIAVPIRFGGTAGAEGQLKDLVGYLRPAAIITTTAVIEALPHLVDTNVIDGDAIYARATASDAPTHPIRRPNSDDVALIQCTSGSTGTPKGVMISHANLAANCEQFVSALGWTQTDTTVSWAPLYHDMGLITGVLCPVYCGGNTVLMPPGRFLRAPAEWLRHISTYRGAVAAAPNFAYGYVTDRVSDDELAGVDLSSWRVALCGAEPVQPATVQRFVDRFVRWGLPSNALIPAYGMAEASLVITTTRPEASLVFDSIDRQAAAIDAQAVDVDPQSADALQIVDCGEPVAATEVRIVDSHGHPLGENQIGYVQFRSPSRTVGYFNLPDETAASIDSPDWWKTGDVGYLRDGGLRITSRVKDLIIIRGANYFPSDFEQAAETVPGVRLGAVIAVGHRDDHGDSEELHLIIETELDSEQHESLRRAIRAAVGSRTGVRPAGIHLAPKRSIPKTTSGKLQRAKARELFITQAALTELAGRDSS